MIFLRVEACLYFRRAVEEPEYHAHRKKNANPPGVDDGSVLIP